ncbi:hypothetical protein PHMEG_00030024 [Phytophthora megakarya]|uniref:Eukaryotic/viral aspartic protease n=1 Tax=Phytophthora megakarya TaxID=4795 RepID=A0A225V248_9STRA|nr:hypothetical protein PHMEG_00030024 [Phytophthora megakarya]
MPAAHVATSCSSKKPSNNKWLNFENKPRNTDLQRQLEDYRLANLEDRLRGGTFKVGRVMNFLNRHNARVSGNWPCLKALLEKFKGGSLPPDAWKTQIQIYAADEFDADPGAYEHEVESDDEKSKVPDVPKPQVALKISTVDLTGPSSTESTPAKIQRKLFSGSKTKALTDFMLRPSVYAPSMTDTLDPTTAKQLSATKARESLTQPAIWDKLRADIQEFMRSHMSYDEALAAARADAKIHSHLDARQLISMLVPIIYWKSLDRTPWAKYVPSRCYKEAESKLAKTLTSGEIPIRWPNLRKDIQDDAVEIMAALYDSVTEEEDDEGRDAAFSPGDDSQSKPQRPNAVTQSFGFPDYAPNLAKDEDVQAPRERWDPVAFKELMDTRPRDVMFEDRSKFLILHVRDNLRVVARESLDAIVAFMSTDDPYSEELHRERKAECDKAKKEYKKLLDDRVDAGLEVTILDEPVKDDGTRYTLNEQMELLDDQEPARVQWNTCASDEGHIKHLPEKYPLKLLKGSQRSS